VSGSLCCPTRYASTLVIYIYIRDPHVLCQLLPSSAKRCQSLRRLPATSCGCNSPQVSQTECLPPSGGASATGFEIRYEWLATPQLLRGGLVQMQETDIATDTPRRRHTCTALPQKRGHQSLVRVSPALLGAVVCDFRLYSLCVWQPRYNGFCPVSFATPFLTSCQHHLLFPFLVNPQRECTPPYPSHSFHISSMNRRRRRRNSGISRTP
jgi:hypothetical protein